MKSLLFAAALLTSCFVSAQEAYTLFNNAGERVTFDQMADSLAKADVVFVGENHNCPISHWMELKITEAMHSAHGDRLVLGEEMLEADNQLILDEYMQKLIPYDRFEAEARLWDNYQTDYYPVVYYAKDNGIPFVATNVPRRYAAAVRESGFEALDKLSDEAKQYLPPLPIPFEYDEEKAAESFGAMRLMRGNSNPEDDRRLAEAQALKDATMGWFIAKNMPECAKFVHINGTMHSNGREGIIPYLLKYRPGTRVAVVTSLRQEGVGSLDADSRGVADFYIVVPEDFPTSY